MFWCKKGPMITKNTQALLILIWSSVFFVKGGSYGGTFDVFKVGPGGQLNPVALNQELVPSQQRLAPSPPYQNNQFFNTNQNQYHEIHRHNNNQRPNFNDDEIIVAVVDESSHNNDHFRQPSFPNILNTYNQRPNNPYEVVIIEDKPQRTNQDNPQTRPGFEHLPNYENHNADDIYKNVFGDNKNFETSKPAFGNVPNGQGLNNDYFKPTKKPSSKNNNEEKHDNPSLNNNKQKYSEPMKSNQQDIDTLINDIFQDPSNGQKAVQNSTDDGKKDLNSENKLIDKNIEGIFGDFQNDQGSRNAKPKFIQKENPTGFVDKSEDKGYTQHEWNEQHNQYQPNYNNFRPPCNQFGCHSPPPPPPSSWGPLPGPHPPPPPHHGHPPPHNGYYPPPHGHSLPHGYHTPPPYYGGYQESEELYEGAHRPPPLPEYDGYLSRGVGVNPLSTDTSQPAGQTYTSVTDDASSPSKVEKGNLGSTTSTMSTPYKPDIDVRFGRDDSIVFPKD